MAQFRHCKKCEREKPLVDFPVYDRERGWRRHECRSCNDARVNYHHLLHKESRLARAKARYKASPSATRTEEQRQVVRARSRGYRKQWFDVVLDHYGRRCACCGETEPTFLTIDHVNNDGAKLRKIHGVGMRLYRWIIRNEFPEYFRVLCYNCNCGRHRNGGTCPHKVTEGSTTIPSGSTLQAIGSGSAQRP